MTIDISKLKVAQNHVKFALSRFYGLGDSLSSKLCFRFGISAKLKANKLPPAKLSKLKVALNSDFVLETRLKFDENEIYKRLSMQGCYRGKRLGKGLPVRGQRTHSNANTAYRLRLRYNLSK